MLGWLTWQVISRVAKRKISQNKVKLGAGEFFGEIALLREERRTATVTATSPMVLIVLTGSSFRSLDGSRPEIRETVSKALAERRSSVSR